MAEKVSGKNCRQGKNGKSVLYVLGTSVSFMLVALVGLMVWQGWLSPTFYSNEFTDGSRKVIAGSMNGQSGSVAGQPNASSASSDVVPAWKPVHPQTSIRNANP